MGSLSQNWLNEFYTSCSPSIDNNNNNNNNNNNINNNNNNNNINNNLNNKNNFLKEKKTTSQKKTANKENMHLIWPTRRFVEKSIDGIEAGGSLCMPSKNLKPFILPFFRKYLSLPDRSNIPPHIKVFLYFIFKLLFFYFFIFILFIYFYYFYIKLFILIIIK